MPGPEPNAAEDPKGWLAWYNEDQAAKNAGAAKPQAGGTAKPGTGTQTGNSARLPNTGTAPVAQPYGSVKLADIAQSTREIPGSGGVRINQLGFTYTPGSDGTYRVSTGYSQSAGGRAQVPGIWTGAAQGMTPTGQNTSPLSSAIGNSVTGSGPTTAQGVVQQGVADPMARQFGGLGGVTGTLGPSQGMQIPGFDAYRQPGIGIPEEGRQTLNTRDSGGMGLNTLHPTGGGGTASQIQYAPSPRDLGQTGSHSVFNPMSSSIAFNPNNRGVDPQMRFPDANVSVPGSYVPGVGNANDANRAFSVPFNISPSGAALMNIGGNNVQLNNADKSVGYGFALDAAPGSNVGLTTGRSLSEDPATQAAQILMLNSAIQQGGGGPGAVGALQQTNSNQYSGYGNPGATGFFGGNGGQGQGTYWSNYQSPQGNAANIPVPDNIPIQQPNYGATGQNVGGAGNAVVNAGMTMANSAAPGVASPFGNIPAAGSPNTTGVPNDRDGDGIPDFAKGATVTMGRFSKAPTPFAVGGTVKAADPYAGTSGLTSSAGVQAPVASGSTAPERYTQQPQTTQSASQAGMAQMANSAPAQNNTSNQFAAPATASSSTNPAASTGTSLDTNANPELQQFINAQQQAGQMDHARANDAGLYSRAGLAGPQGVAYQGADAAQGQLGPGQYTDYSGWLNKFLGEAQSKQQQIQQLGGAGQDTSNSILQQNLINQQLAPWQQANDFQLKRAGLGQVEDPSVIQQRINGIKSAAGPIAGISDAGQKLTALGAPHTEQELNGVGTQIGTAESNVAQAQAGLTALAQNPGNTPDYAQKQAALQQQLADASTQLTGLRNLMGQMQGHNNNISELQSTIQNLYAATGLTQEQLTPALAAYQTQIDAEGQKLQNSQSAANYTSQIANLTGNVTDPSQIAGKIAGYQNQLLPFSTQIQNAQQAGQISSQLHNQLQTAVPKFAKGAKLVTPEQIDLVGKSGKVYGTMGEPHYPGGPNMKEKVTFPGRNKMKITPLNKPAPPLGKFGRKKVAA